MSLVVMTSSTSWYFDSILTHLILPYKHCLGHVYLKEFVHPWCEFTVTYKMILQKWLKFFLSKMPKLKQLGWCYRLVCVGQIQCCLTNAVYYSMQSLALCLSRNLYAYNLCLQLIYHKEVLLLLSPLITFLLIVLWFCKPCKYSGFVKLGRVRVTVYSRIILCFLKYTKLFLYIVQGLVH